MARFIFYRLKTMIPTIIGITIVTFVLINLAIDTTGTSNSNTLDQEASEDLQRTYGLHLPMFFNFSIDDVQTRTNQAIRQLGNPEKEKAVKRSLSQMGGAVLPYLLKKLDRVEGSKKAALLDVLDSIAPSIDLADDLRHVTNKEAFWLSYRDTYAADFTPVRASRLVRRYIKRDDHLAYNELKRLGTYSLPQLMAALEQTQNKTETKRIVNFLCRITERQDPITAHSTRQQRRDTVVRWQEWWYQRYDLYTSFEGIDKVTGTVTETRYFKWFARIITFDFGVSTRDGVPIREKITRRLPVTLLLASFALFFAYIFSIPTGIAAAVKHDSAFDKITGAVTFFMYSLPGFWVALILLQFFSESGYLHWFPAQGLTSPSLPEYASRWEVAKDVLHHLTLPIICMSFVSIAMLTRFQRVGMLRVVDQEYIQAARAKGLSELRIILKHGLRNGIIPVITLMGLQLPFLISTSVVIEKIFGIPGMGLETFEAIRAADYPWLMAMVTVMAILTTLGILASDVIYAFVDPRIAPGRKLGQKA